jgi:uncharacterized repeat protein (TIGR01451 family)
VLVVLAVCMCPPALDAAVADLSITKIGSPGLVEIDDDITYTITVTNKGPDTAANVTLTDTLPPDVTYFSDSAGCDELDGIVTCDLGSLASGESTEIIIEVTADAAGSLTNTVTVASDASDGVSSNNTAQAVSTVAALLPDLMPEIVDEDITCDDTKGLVCQLLAEVTLMNNEEPFATGMFQFAASCKKCPDTPKWKLSGTLTITSLNLSGIPDHSLALYLSDDDELDPTDIRLVKKSIGIQTLANSFQGGKPMKLKAKVPAGADLSELFVLLVADEVNQVTEGDEENNAAAFGPFD